MPTFNTIDNGESGLSVRNTLNDVINYVNTGITSGGSYTYITEDTINNTLSMEITSLNVTDRIFIDPTQYLGGTGIYNNDLLNSDNTGALVLIGGMVYGTSSNTATTVSDTLKISGQDGSFLQSDDATTNDNGKMAVSSIQTKLFLEAVSLDMITEVRQDLYNFGGTKIFTSCPSNTTSSELKVNYQQIVLQSDATSGSQGKIDFDSATMNLTMNDGGNTSYIRVEGDTLTLYPGSVGGGYILLKNLPTFTDNATAAAGGVPIDGLYKRTTASFTQLCIRI